MKILCDRHQLHEAFAIVAGLAPTKTPKPIVQNVLLRAADGKLRFHGTDLEMSARVELDAVKIEREGAVLLPARETSALLRELSDPTVTLKSEDERCKIECGGGSFQLVGDDPEKFPAEIVLETATSLTLPARRFADMVRQTAFAAAREESRYAVSGALLECVDHGLRMVATDGRRLALSYVQEVTADDTKARAIVPTRALNTLLRSMPEAEGSELTLLLGEKQIGFAFDDVLLISQLLDSNFPEYEGVIPKAAETTVEIDRSLLESNLRRVAVLSSGDTRAVRFEFSSSSLRLSAESAGVGRADLTIDVDVQGAGGSVNFNPDYVLDALKVSDAESIQIAFTDESTPAKMTLGESFTYVVMPISGS